MVTVEALGQSHPLKVRHLPEQRVQLDKELRRHQSRQNARTHAPGRIATAGMDAIAGTRTLQRPGMATTDASREALAARRAKATATSSKLRISADSLRTRSVLNVRSQAPL